jgi:hypothetical protein
MEALHAYIERARVLGQTDKQIRRALVAGGWNATQVDVALREASPAPPAVRFGDFDSPSPVSDEALLGQNSPPVGLAANTSIASALTVPPQSPPSATGRKFRKYLVIVAVLLFVMTILAVGTYSLFFRKTSYQAVIQQFVMAMQDKNKAAADTLESPASKAAGQKVAGTASFYTDCQQVGQPCIQLFSASYLAKATKTYHGYKAKNGTKGKEITYTSRQSISGTQVSGTNAQDGRQGCTITTDLTISAVPKGRTWLIEINYLNPHIKLDAATLCAGLDTTSG